MLFEPLRHERPASDRFPDSFRSILDRWKSMAGLSRDLDLPYFTIASWRRRDSVPQIYWEALEAAAIQRGMRGITYAVCRDLAAAMHRRKATGTRQSSDAFANSNSPNPSVLSAPATLSTTATVVQVEQHLATGGSRRE